MKSLMHTYTVDGRDVHGACLVGTKQHEDFLAEEWPFDDNTVFIVRDEERKILIGVVAFARWFKRKMLAPSKSLMGPSIWFMACQPTDELDRDIIAANWLDEIDNTIRG